MPLAAVVLAGCSKSPSAAQQSPGRGDAAGRGRAEGVKAIKTARVEQETVHRGLDVVGTLAAEDDVTVSSQADGIVARILVDLGDRVQSGQVLVELDREKLQYNLDQQRAALARALANYGATQPDSLPPIEQTPDVKKAAAESMQAKQAYDRALELNKRQLIPKQTLDDADMMRRSKEASYDSALQSARNMGADVDGANAAAKLAERQLRDATIRAPFDGYIQKRLISLGELVKVQTPLMSVVRVNPLKVIAEIPEGMTPWVKSDEPVELQVDAYPDRKFPGRMSRISPAVNTQTRAFAFEALVPNGEGVLKPGTFARVHVATTQAQQVLTLPYAALQYRYGVNRAFVVTDGKLSGREVKLGDRMGDRIEVTGGVSAGDQVALTDVDNLLDGMQVTLDTRSEKPSEGGGERPAEGRGGQKPSDQ
jgi:RND family efflux transporter MFP subunit